MEALIRKIGRPQIIRFLLLCYVVISFFLVIFLGDILLTTGYRDKSKITFINDNWDIKINEKGYKDVSLEEFSFDVVTMDDVVEMTTMLPDDWKYKDAVMCFHTRQATVDMYVDGELVYDYGHDRKDNGKTVGSGLLFINMFDEYKGKELKISLTVSEKQAFSRLDEVWISEWQDSYRYVVTKNRFPMFIGFFFVVFGIITVSVAGVATAFSRKYLNILFLAVFLICVGLWALCYYNCVIIFSLPLYSITLMEYMSLLLAPIPIILFMREYVSSLDSKLYRVIHKIIFIVQFIFTNIFITLHGTDILHAAVILPYFHILIFIELIFFSIVLIKSMRRKRRMLGNSTNSVIIGPALAIIFITYDLVIYLANRYLGYDMPQIQGFSTMGIITFLIILLKDYWAKATEKLIEDQENALLEKRAYIDGLTMMNNRRYCSEYIANLKKDEDITVISLDLNGLKKINDVCGHSKGDCLIKMAAKIISDSFGKSGVVGRVGGDEFIAILKTVDKVEIDKLIDGFNKAIYAANDNDHYLKVSIALGYASSNEFDNCDNYEKIYNLADKRMYENKKQFKKW